MLNIEWNTTMQLNNVMNGMVYIEKFFTWLHMSRVRSRS